MTVAIASGKGGTGKTTLAVNLAAWLARSRPVVLADLDVEEPNSGLFIKGTLEERTDIFRMVPSWDSDSCTFCGLCQEVCNFHSVIKMGDRIMVFSELCHGCLACSELCPVIEAVKDADLRLLKKSFAVVINRHGLGNADVEGYCAAEKIAVIAKIPNRRSIAELYSKGELIFNAVPEVAAELTKIAGFIEDAEAGRSR